MNEDTVTGLTSETAADEAVSEEVGGSGGNTTIVYDVHLWDEHPMMTTSFEDYSVAEGLLLLIFVILLLDFFFKLFRR